MTETHPTLVVELGEGIVVLVLILAGMVIIGVSHVVLTHAGDLAVVLVGNLESFVLHRFILVEE